MYTKREQHKEIVEKVEIISSSLDNYVLEAKKFNNREQLLQKTSGDYSKVENIQREFMNYSHYWNIVHKWSYL